MKSISSRLLFTMLIISIIGMGLTTGIVTALNAYSLHEQSLGRISEATKLKASEINSLLREQITYVNSLAVSISTKYEKESVPALLDNLAQDNELLNNVYVGYPNGTCDFSNGFLPDNDTWKSYENDWYKGAAASDGAAYISKVYADVVTGKPCISISRAYYTYGALAGVVSIDLPAAVFSTAVSENNIGDGAYSFMGDADGDLIIHPEERLQPSVDESGNTVLTNIRTLDGGSYTALMDEGIINGEYLQLTGTDGVERYYSVSTVENGAWRVFSTLPVSTVNAPIYSDLLIALVIFLSVLLASSVFIHLMIKKIIVKPIALLSGGLKKLADGDFNFKLPTEKQDEVGELSRDIMNVAGTIEAVTNDLSEVNSEIHIKGNYEYKIDSGKYKGSYKEMVENIDNVFDGFLHDLLTFLNVFTEIENGNFNYHMEKLPGKKVALNEACDSLMSNLKGIQKEIVDLAENAANGEFAFTKDAGKRKGDWAKIINGLDALITAVATPLAEVENTLREVSAGNLTAHVNGNYKGSFEKLKEEVNLTVSTTLSYIGEISDILTAMSEGDLTVTIKRDYIGNYMPIKEALLRILKNLNKSLGEIDVSASEVLSGASQISQSALEIANSATKQANAVEELLISVDSVNKKAQDTTENTNNVNELTIKSASNANTGHNEMKNLVQSMDGIKESSANISKIIKAIDDIAFQTNLLALNASVEAARAGEFGKGFAVVAMEVRNLAERSQQAARETESLIEDSVDRVNKGMLAAHQTSDALETIVENVDDVKGLISETAALFSSQKESVDRINDEVNKISSAVMSNSSVSQECAAASQELNSQAEMLKQLISFFKFKK